MNDLACSPVERWLAVLSNHLDAQFSRGTSRWTLSGTSQTWRRYLRNLFTDEERVSLDDSRTASVNVAFDPSTKEEWRNRFRLVEKSAAQALTNAPVGFLAVLPSGKRGAKARVARLAFGYSLSLGKRVRRRFTAYFLPESDESCFRCGDDHILDDVERIAPLDLKQEAVHSALGRLIAAASNAEQEYRQDAQVVAEVARIRREYAKELRCLERLYTSNSGQDAPLLGLPATGLKGDDAVEAEYVSRLQDLMDRYQPRVLFEPLTLSIVENCNEAKLLRTCTTA